MSNKIYVTPNRGLQVHNPATGKPLPQEGAEVVDSVWWHRRIRHGEVTVGKPKTKAKKVSKKPAEKKPTTFGDEG